MDLSEHEKKLTEQGALTIWGWQREVDYVETRQESNQPSDTHRLEKLEGATCQDMERRDKARCTHSLKLAGEWAGQNTKINRPSDRHLLSGNGREALVRKRQESDQPSGTHRLGKTEGDSCQDTEKESQRGSTHSLETAMGGTCVSGHKDGD